MSMPRDPLSLAHWRREVAELYAAARAASERDPPRAAEAFRAGRDRLFREHVDSPIAEAQRARWKGTSWYPYDPSWRIHGEVELASSPSTFEIALASDGILHCAHVGTVRFAVHGKDAQLALYWLCGYGGGLWLPFTDATSGETTYPGGRYLYDTIKGADLGASAGKLVLDFNYAYNPSCAYDVAWSCPLSPPDNRLRFAVNAGEQSIAS